MADGKGAVHLYPADGIYRQHAIRFELSIYWFRDEGKVKLTDQSVIFIKSPPVV